MKKIVVLDNIIFSLQSKGGISRVWKSISSHLQVDEVKTINDFRRNSYGNFFSQIIRYFPAWLYWATSRHVFVSSYYRISLHPLAVNVVLVHDLIYEKFHRWSLGTFLHTMQRRLAFRFAKRIICVSNNTRKDLIKFYPKIDPRTVSVIPNGIEEKFIFTRNVRSQKNQLRFLYVGSRGFCKNFPKVVEALRLFPDLECVCVTPHFSAHEKSEYADVWTRLHVISQIDDEALIDLYHECKFLLMPSLYEGFGLPVVEAFAAGTNVVLPYEHCFPEVAGAHGIFYSPDSVSSFVAAIEVALQGSSNEEALQRYATSFLWEKIGIEYSAELFKWRK